MHVQCQCIYSHVLIYAIGKAEIKTLGRGLHHSTLFPLSSCGYCFLETTYQDDSIMTPDLHCAYQRLVSSYLFGENHSDIATEHGNARLRT